MGYIIYDKRGGYTGFLGNIMFQWASVVGIAVANRMEYRFPPKPEAQLFLGDFTPAAPEFINKYAWVNYPVDEFHYVPLTLNRDLNYNLTGYFQSEKYWSHIGDRIKAMFSFRQPIMDWCLQYLSLLEPQSCLVALHVRRGDYLKYPEHHPVLPVEYYENALKLIDGMDNCPKKILVFSNDMAWCREVFTHHPSFKERVLFMQSGATSLESAAQDMCLMSMCRHVVMANSSFSWWGAYLNRTKEKMVIAPAAEKWHGKAYAHWKHDDLYLPDWIVI